MPRFIYVSPTQSRVYDSGSGKWLMSPPQYITITTKDANIPAGYILTSGSDGAEDEALQVFEPGVNSQGDGVTTPTYTGDANQLAVAQAFKAAGKGFPINGILGGPIGSAN